ncbi:MAG: AraC family transcriptional regulator [Crocinitomix sp.]|nr:AraC family transcriptional regulator [Crocinitomix sp.]
METQKLAQLKIVGIEIRTQNAPGKAEQDIPALWGKFMSENISAQLPNKVSEEIYCVYCEYEGDHLAPYTALIGYAIPESAAVPSLFKAIDIPTSDYAVFKAEGDLTAGAVFDAWNTIWKTDLNRTYMADFEVYGEEATNPKDGKIEIFVAIK